MTTRNRIVFSSAPIDMQSVNHLRKIFHQFLTLTSSWWVCKLVVGPPPSWSANEKPFSSVSNAGDSRFLFTIFQPGNVLSNQFCQWKLIGPPMAPMTRNWKKRTRSKTNGTSSLYALSRWAIKLEQQSMKSARRHDDTIGENFMVAGTA